MLLCGSMTCSSYTYTFCFVVSDCKCLAAFSDRSCFFLKVTLLPKHWLMESGAMGDSAPGIAAAEISDDEGTGSFDFLANAGFQQD